MIDPTRTPEGCAHPWGDAATPYDEIGGDDAVRALVDDFYDYMDAESPVVRAMHPDDLDESRDKLYEFLSGWLGGPPIYHEKRGHPRLRARHMPFAIDQRAVDEWLRCMGLAMDKRGVAGALRAFMDAKLDHLANFMRNR